MHIVLIDGKDHRAGAFIFPCTSDWRTGTVIHPSFRCLALNWTTPGFLRIEPELPKGLPSDAPPSPLEIWIPVDMVLSVFRVPDDQPMPNTASMLKH